MNRFRAFWIHLRSSLWFVPCLIILTAIGLGLLLAEVGHYDPLTPSRLPTILAFSAEGSREMLSAIASSMITVAGVAFSITIVTLSLASTQYSPRVLRHFMRDRGNQVVLGVFVGIFAYCLTVLPRVRGGEEHGYVPAVAVAFAVLLALVGVGCLVYFIHHVASAIQASAILASIASETHRSIRELFPQSLGEEDEGKPGELERLEWHPVPAKRSGFIQMVDDDTLLQAAIENDVVIRMECRIGEFVVRGSPLASITTSDLRRVERLQNQIDAAFRLNRTRTVEQDAAFGLRQIVDVALRALSPAQNDTTTGVMCINYLADLLSHVAARQVQSPYRRKDGSLRVIATRPDFADLVVLAFDQVRFAGRDNSVILERLIWALGVVSVQTRVSSRLLALARCAGAIASTAAKHLEDEAERERIIGSARSLASKCCSMQSVQSA